MGDVILKVEQATIRPFWLMDVLKVVDGMTDELVPGADNQDVRDAVVHLQGKLVEISKLPNRSRMPRLTLRDEWAVRLIFRCFGEALLRSGGDGASGASVGRAAAVGRQAVGGEA